MEHVSLRISSEMAEAIALIARSEDATSAEVIRDAIRRDLSARCRLPGPSMSRGRRFAPLRALLRDDLNDAYDWRDLAERLGSKGYRLIEDGEALFLHRLSGERVCSATDLGTSFERLNAQFSRPGGASHALAG